MKFGFLLMVLLLSSCQTLLVQEEQDATLVVSNSDVQKELSETVGRLIGVSRILLKPDELMTTSFLTVERIRLRDPSGLVLQGFETEEPNVFKLRKKDGDCFLVHQKSGGRSLLSIARCQVR
jgi:hypothetical protein